MTADKPSWLSSTRPTNKLAETLQVPRDQNNPCRFHTTRTLSGPTSQLENVDIRNIHDGVSQPDTSPRAIDPEWANRASCILEGDTNIGPAPDDTPASDVRSRCAFDSDHCSVPVCRADKFRIAFWCTCSSTQYPKHVQPPDIVAAATAANWKRSPQRQEGVEVIGACPALESVQRHKVRLCRRPLCHADCPPGVFPCPCRGCEDG